jgi:aspartate carbamoyltransferase catalytic subunit
MGLKRKDILGLEEMGADEINLILNTGEALKEIIARPIKKVPTLRGKSIINLFYESSTRTRTSFELAGKYLSADTTSIATATSAVQKGETLLDTAKNLEAMGFDIFIVRHQSAGAPHFLARNMHASVINAGDGMHEHPTQGLLDMLSIRQRLGQIDGLTVTIVGDILHSRVARSNIWGLTKLGAKVRVCGPETLLPPEIERMGVEVYTDLDAALAGADVVNVLRLQLERQQKGLFPTIREYHDRWGVTRQRLAANPDVLIMHPGPMNRGVEIDTEVADCKQSTILPQVTNGVAIRMACLYLLLGGGDLK